MFKTIKSYCVFIAGDYCQQPAKSDKIYFIQYQRGITVSQDKPGVYCLAALKLWIYRQQMTLGGKRFHLITPPQSDSPRGKACFMRFSPWRVRLSCGSVKSLGGQWMNVFVFKVWRWLCPLWSISRFCLRLVIKSLWYKIHRRHNLKEYIIMGIGSTRVYVSIKRSV